MEKSINSLKFKNSDCLFVHFEVKMKTKTQAIPFGISFYIFLVNLY